MLIVAIIGAITPWPSAMVIRAVFTQGGDATAAEMEKHVPDAQLTETLDISYGDDGADTTMDVFTPVSATKAAADDRVDPRRCMDLGVEGERRPVHAHPRRRGVYDDRGELHDGPGGHATRPR